MFRQQITCDGCKEEITDVSRRFVFIGSVIKCEPHRSLHDDNILCDSRYFHFCCVECVEKYTKEGK